MNRISFPQSRIKDLRQHVREQRRIQQKHTKSLETLLKELEGKGIDVTRIIEILEGVSIHCLESQKNFNYGITRFDKNGPFPEIKARHNEFTKEQRRVQTALNSLISSMGQALQCYLPEKEGYEASGMIESLLKSAHNYYAKALFFGMFKPLLDLEYLDCSSPFADDDSPDDDRMSYFQYVVSCDAFNPYNYLGSRPLKRSSHHWRDCILGLDKVLRPVLGSKIQSARKIAALLHHRFPLIFTSEEVAFTKADRSLRR
ncbi:MAG: hypothetical protein R2940_16730 [Syntrophotaleaceae bacterium]